MMIVLQKPQQNANRYIGIFTKPLHNDLKSIHEYNPKAKNFNIASLELVFPLIKLSPVTYTSVVPNVRTVGFIITYNKVCMNIKVKNILNALGK